jgi:hypothetical protein
MFPLNLPERPTQAVLRSLTPSQGLRILPQIWPSQDKIAAGDGAGYPWRSISTAGLVRKPPAEGGAARGGEAGVL